MLPTAHEHIQSSIYAHAVAPPYGRACSRSVPLLDRNQSYRLSLRQQRNESALNLASTPKSPLTTWLHRPTFSEDQRKQPNWEDFQFMAPASKSRKRRRGGDPPSLVLGRPRRRAGQTHQRRVRRRDRGLADGHSGTRRNFVTDSNPHRISSQRITANQQICLWQIGFPGSLVGQKTNQK